MTELNRVAALVEEGADEGLHIGFLLSARIGDDHVLWTFGDAAPGVPMQADTLMMWASATKPITAAAVLQLVERGHVGLDEQVTDYVPEFNGAVTIRQVLTHTAGLKHVPTELGWTAGIQQICAEPFVPGFTPGTRAAYSPASGALLLGEIVQRITGAGFADHVKQTIFEPLGMRDSWMSLPPERHQAYGRRVGVMYNTTTHPPEPEGWDTPLAAARCFPGGSGRGPVGDLSLFYTAIPLRAETLEQMTSRQRTGMRDETFRAFMDWGLFTIPQNPGAPYDYGEHASMRAYGHGGYQSSVAFHDPDHDLSVAMIFNGTCGESAHSKRQRAVCSALYEDLGLA